MSYKRADIIPLIGGMSIGGEQAFGKRPDHLISWKPFAANDSHIVNHYGDVPYHVLDDGGKLPRGKIDVVSSTCPCAGLFHDVGLGIGGQPRQRVDVHRGRLRARYGAARGLLG